VVGDVLGHLERSAVFEVGGDAGGAEGVVADQGLDAGLSGPSADHAEDVLLVHGGVVQLARASSRGAEERTVEIAGDAGSRDVLVEVAFEVVMTGDLVLLSALLGVKPTLVS